MGKVSIPAWVISSSARNPRLSLANLLNFIGYGCNLDSLHGLVQNLRLLSPFDWQGPNSSMVVEFAYSAIRTLQLIV